MRYITHNSFPFNFYDALKAKQFSFDSNLSVTLSGFKVIDLLKSSLGNVSLKKDIQPEPNLEVQIMHEVPLK